MARPQSTDEELLAELKAQLDSERVPDDIATVANLAFQLRDLEVVETEAGEPELAGVRSGQMMDLHRVVQGDTVLAWRIEADLVVGVFEPDGTVISCRLVSEEQSSTEVGRSGSFEFPCPTVPWRLEVTSTSSSSWATEWQPGRS